MMKKILFTLGLIALTAAAHAQFVVSLHLGGASSSGNSSTVVAFTNADTSFSNTKEYNAPKPLTLTGGVKAGYQFGRLQVGLSGSSSWNYSSGDLTMAEFFAEDSTYGVHFPIDASGEPLADVKDYVGWFKQHTYSYTIAPYVRYELVQVGDVALFAELSLYFGKSGYTQRHDSLDWYYRELHYTIDTAYEIQSTSTSLGAKITPGLSWQIHPHCYVDLYLDFLSFIFDNTTYKNIEEIRTYDYTAEPRVLSRRTTITTTRKTTDLGFGVQGTPLLSNRNWVRVGINYTF